MHADKVFLNGNIYTMKDENDKVEAIAVRDEKIIFTGTNQEAREIEAAEVIDLGGKTVIPGLIDTHLHLLAYCQSLATVNLAGAVSMDELIERLRRRAENTPPGQWVMGTNMDHTRLKENRLPTRQDLDRASTEHPIFVRRCCLHTFVVNSRALEIARIDRDYRPPVKGTVEFDGTGQPTGIIREQASGIFYELMPMPLQDFEEQKRALEEVFKDASSKGLTGMHTYAAGIWKYNEYLGVYQALEEEGKLPVRMTVCFDTLPSFGMRPGFGTSKVKYGAYKLFCDGSLGSRSAALLEPYSDCLGHMGITNYTQEELNEKVQTAYDMGLQIAIHANADRSLDMALTAIENAYFRNPRKDPRFRLIHVQLVNEKLIERMKRLPVVLDIQPKFLNTDMYWIEDRLGKERCKMSYLWKRLIREGFILTGGSDCPVEPFNPFLGIFAAVTRQDFNGYPECGWYPEQRLTVYEAISLFTKNAAYATYEENIKGTLEAGKLADFVVLDRNPFAIEPLDLQHIQVLKTFLGGEQVYCR